MSTYNDKTAEQWAQQMQALMGEIENREPFSYDPEADTLYRQYREQYQTLGRQAMEDTMGQAAGLTGGYGSTYGQTAGAEAYESYLGKLNELLPEFYDRKQAAYDSRTDQLYDALSFAAGQKKDEEDSAAAEEKAAFDRCMKLLENGIRPSDSDLAAAGLTSAMANTALAIFHGQTSGTTGSGGQQSHSTDTESHANYDNGGLSANQVKELQNWLGVTADGQYGPKTQAAAEAYFGTSGMSAVQAWIAFQKAIGAYSGGHGAAGPNYDMPV